VGTVNAKLPWGGCVGTVNAKLAWGGCVGTVNAKLACVETSGAADCNARSAFSSTDILGCSGAVQIHS
jgi:hypothetical protein